VLNEKVVIVYRARASSDQDRCAAAPLQVRDSHAYIVQARLIQHHFESLECLLQQCAAYLRPGTEAS
jgi:hypothetical protein